MALNTMGWIISVTTDTLLRETGVTDASGDERAEARQLARTVFSDVFASLESPCELSTALTSTLRHAVDAMASTPEDATPDQIAVVAGAARAMLSAAPAQTSPRPHDASTEQLSLLDRVQS